MKRFADELAPDALAIFLLHGVMPQPTSGLRNYTRKHISASAFREFCEALLRKGVPLGAADALRALRAEEPLRPRSFLLTFDDGFANNLEVAAPIMRELGVPAIIYVTTSFVDEQRASWVDLIEEAVSRCKSDSVRLPWDDVPRPAVTLDQRIALMDEVRTVVKSDGAWDPYEVAEVIRRQTGAGPFAPDPVLDRKLGWDDARALDRDPLFTIGGHSHTHRILSHLSPDELDAELDISLGLLERELRRRPEHYSYPEGLEHTYSDRVIEGLRRRGIVCCPTAEPGLNRPGEDLFRLRRIPVV